MMTLARQLPGLSLGALEKERQETLKRIETLRAELAVNCVSLRSRYKTRALLLVAYDRCDMLDDMIIQENNRRMYGRER